MPDEKDVIKRVIMTRNVARRYLEEMSSSGKTLTVYSSKPSQLTKLIQTVRQKYGESVLSIKEEFDYATFLALDEHVFDDIKHFSEKKGLETWEHDYE